MKPFNLGNVWGRVSGVKHKKTDKDRPYLQVQVECANELYGNVKAYGRLWGDDKITSFIDHFKQHSGAGFRLTGFFSQYDDPDGRRLSNFTFFKWAPFEGSEFRASFILAGEVTDIKNEEGEGIIQLHLIREGKEGYKDNEESFRIYTLNAKDASGLKPGAFIQIKGLLRAREPEDYFGLPSGQVKAYAMEIKTKNNEEDSQGPF